MAVAARTYTIRIRTPHAKQAEFIESKAKRKVIRAGRRGGKTTGMAITAVEQFMKGRRVLYATPTLEQIGRFWSEVKRSLAEAIEAGALIKNETLHTIEMPGSDNGARIRAKTAWNADTLRGDYADVLILDEFQLMAEETWTEVGAPMLIDNDGDAIFVYTPPSLATKSRSKAKDPRYAAKLFVRARTDSTGRWAAFHFKSYDNPTLSRDALSAISEDMTATAIRQEIDAEDLDEAPGALWTRALIETTRLPSAPRPDFARIAIGVDPPGGVTECGIVAVGKAHGTGHRYVIADRSAQLTPQEWARAVIDLYIELKADFIVAEINFGGDMVESIIRQAAKARGVQVRIKPIRASRGKAVRAEPVVAGYERREIHHLGSFPLLEDEMTLWVPGETLASPNRVDALVWAATALGKAGAGAAGV